MGGTKHPLARLDSPKAQLESLIGKLNVNDQKLTRAALLHPNIVFNQVTSGVEYSKRLCIRAAIRCCAEAARWRCRS